MERAEAVLEKNSSASTQADDGALLIDFFLKDQQQLTAVERFSQVHDQHALPAQARYYRDLIPANLPAEGQQYGFEVDLDACTGCKACVTACHSLNGLDETETWRSVGLLTGGTKELPMFQMVTAACHHCADPACMNGCPVKAYDKDSVTGIVKHLDDQCIGCQYCILKCPYDVPKYNPSKGIVRKCDMCSDRLAAQEAPACVQACPNTAIRIVVVDKETAFEKAKLQEFLVGAPDPSYTAPTTTYKTRKAMPCNTAAADNLIVRPQHSHLPLVFMLVLTQLSVGAFLMQQVLGIAAGEIDDLAQRIFGLCALGFGIAGLGAAVLHLGRPLYAFRAVIGIRKSWLSREIVVFNLFAGLALAFVASLWLPESALPVSAAAKSALGISAAMAGLAGVFCSAMIYIDTRREFWSARFTFPKFFLTTLILGTAAALPLGGTQQPLLFTTLALLGAAKLVFELSLFRHLQEKEPTSLKKSAFLLADCLKPVMEWRISFGLIGGVTLPILMAMNGGADSLTVLNWNSTVIILACFAGELLERYLYFKAVVPLKMPGGIE